MNTFVSVDERKFESVYWTVPDDVFFSDHVNKHIFGFMSFRIIFDLGWWVGKLYFRPNKPKYYNMLLNADKV
jgi:hypothetical protein